MIVYNLDTWDTIGFGNNVPGGLVGNKVHLSVPNEPFTVLTQYQFDSEVFAGTIIDPVQGAILEPTRNVQFFPIANTMHLRYNHNSNNLTSIKKSIRAIMPSDFITESHWAVLYGIFVSVNDQGIATSVPMWKSTKVSLSVDITFNEIVAFCSPSTGYPGSNTWFELIYVTYIIRRAL